MRKKTTKPKRATMQGEIVPSATMRREILRVNRLLLCLLVALCGLLAGAPHAAAGPRASKSRKNARELRRDLTRVRSQIRAKRAAIRETRRKEHKITDEISSVEDRLLGAEARVRRARGRLAYLTEQQGLLTGRIAAAEKRLVGRRRVLARRLRENYQRGDATYLDVLLQSRSLHDYLSRSYYVERIVDSDTKLVAGIKADQRQMAEDKRKLDAQAAEQRAVQAELEEAAAQYRADVERKRDLLTDVRDTRENLEQALDELESDSRDIESRIRASQQTPRGRVRMSRAWTGSFIRPANGPITSGFGMRYHPILHRTRMHTGLDIGAGYGAAIHAAGSGEVIVADHMRGYGNTVIIDHGGGVSTLYGHCSELLVSVGQTVRQGQVIARVGSTGLATGPHLHFEVRRNGSPVDPR